MNAQRKAVSYLRVSSLGQVSGDGFDRQREAIASYSSTNRISGTKALVDRPGLSELVARVATNGVQLVLVEKADRLARDLVEGELILRELRGAGVQVIEAESGNDLTSGDDSNPTAKLIRQVLGAVAEFEKSALVAKLRAARNRKRAAGEPCEGRKPYGARDGEAEVIALMRKLYRKQRKGTRRTFAEIARLLNQGGHRTRTGRPWSRGTVHNILSTYTRHKSMRETPQQTPVGPTLDREVAAEVLRQTVRDFGHIPGAGSRRAQPRSLKPYSTDENAANELMAFVSQTFGVKGKVWGSGQEVKGKARLYGPHSVVVNTEDGTEDYRAAGDSYPEAICRVALLVAADERRQHYRDSGGAANG